MLRALHDLDIMDKHQLIIPVQHTNRVTSIQSQVPGVEVTIGRGCHVSIGSGAEISVGGVAPKLDIQTIVVFADNGPAPLSGRPVLETLKELAQLVRGIIKSFELLTSGWGDNVLPTGQTYRLLYGKPI